MFGRSIQSSSSSQGSILLARAPSSSWCSHQRRLPPSRHAATFPHPEAPRTLATSLREAALLGQETQKHGKKKKTFTLQALFAFPLPRALPAAAHPAWSPSLLPGYMEKKKKKPTGRSSSSKGSLQGSSTMAGGDAKHPLPCNHTKLGRRGGFLCL